MPLLSLSFQFSLSWRPFLALVRRVIKRAVTKRENGEAEMESHETVTRRKQKNRKRQRRRGHPTVWTSKSSVALLIDGENTSFRHMAFIQSHVVQLGILKPRRVYGDWSSGQLRGWETLLSFYGLQRRHCKPVASGKNAADIALVVDAMQLFYSNGIRTFSLVAADSDYTPLVAALRSRGCFVMVLGMSTTPLALQRASTTFVELPALYMQ